MMKLNIQLFGHSGETTNYDLPQFVGTDKPTWLGDFNTAMDTIDTAIAENASDITSLGTRVASAESAASQASTDVASLTSTVSTLSSNVQSATTTANNAQSTASSALNTANTANGKADTNTANIATNTSDISDLDTRVTSTEDAIALFNLTNVSSVTPTRVSGTFTIPSTARLTVATNADGSLAKVYGQVTITNVTATGTAKISTSLRPESEFNISGACLSAVYSGTTSFKRLQQVAITFKTNGDIVFPVDMVASGDTCRLIFINSLEFIKDFGDTPESGE